MDNNSIQSSTIKVQTLEKEYQNVLNQYDEAQRNYINILSQNQSLSVANSGIDITTKYYILGIGTDGRLWVRKSLDDYWTQVNDDAAYDLISVCTANDNKALIGVNKGNTIYTKSSWDSPNWQGPVQYPCCVISTAMGQDGTLLGVGTDNKLWTKPNINADWTQVASPSEWVSAVAIAPDGSVFVVGYNNELWKKNSYKDLLSQEWQWLGDATCCVRDITIAPDGTFIGVGTDYQLWTKPNYKDLSGQWYGPYQQSCCVLSITTVSNPNYSPNGYDSFFTAVAGSTWWGSTGLKEGPASTQQECENMCVTTTGCTGATFNPVQRYCWARGGDGSILQGDSNYYALVPKAAAALDTVKKINEKLLNLNEQISNELKQIDPQVVQQDKDKNQKQVELNAYYTKLLEQKMEIERQLQDYYSIEENNTNQELYTTQGNASYIFWSLLAILLIIIAIMKLFGIKNAPMSVIVWLAIVGVIIALSFSLSTPAGFMIWFIVVLAVILMKTM